MKAVNDRPAKAVVRSLDKKKDEHRNSGIMFWLLRNSSLEMCIICKYTTSPGPKVSKETVLGLLLERLCWMMLCMKRFPEWGRISWSLHQLVMSVQSLKMQITVPKSIYAFNYCYTPKEHFVNMKRARESVSFDNVSHNKIKPVTSTGKAPTSTKQLILPHSVTSTFSITYIQTAVK